MATAKPRKKQTQADVIADSFAASLYAATTPAVAEPAAEVAPAPAEPIAEPSAEVAPAPAEPVADPVAVSALRLDEVKKSQNMADLAGVADVLFVVKDADGVVFGAGYTEAEAVADAKQYAQNTETMEVIAVTSSIPLSAVEAQSLKSGDLKELKPVDADPVPQAPKKAPKMTSRDVSMAVLSKSKTQTPQELAAMVSGWMSDGLVSRESVRSAVRWLEANAVDYHELREAISELVKPTRASASRGQSSRPSQFHAAVQASRPDGGGLFVRIPTDHIGAAKAERVLVTLATDEQGEPFIMIRRDLSSDAG